MNKTLIGKEGYLFLINDSSQELDVHCNNLCRVSTPINTRFDSHKAKYFITIFPNKSFVQQKYLPDKYTPKYRPAFDIYKSYFGPHLLDGLEIVNDPDRYYKTDTHINISGACRIYERWAHCVGELFGLSIPITEISIRSEKVNSLANLCLGIGDLTWSANLGDQTLDDTSDTYYSSESVESLYLRYTIHPNSAIRILDKQFNDCTEQHTDKILDWNIVSNYILYRQNENGIPKKVVFLYDSFLVSTLSLYLQIFSHTYMIKVIYSKELLDTINPDYIFEFRCERFLF